MIPALYAALLWALTGLIPRLMVGAGLTFLTAAGISTLVNDALNSAAGGLSQLPASVFQVVAMSGVGSALSIVGSAILTRLAIVSATKIIGVAVKK